jgi:agmatine/peptidylarginine deiminase
MHHVCRRDRYTMQHYQRLAESSCTEHDGEHDGREFKIIEQPVPHHVLRVESRRLSHEFTLDLIWVHRVINPMPPRYHDMVPVAKPHISLPSSM